LREATNLLSGFGGKRIEQIGAITLLISSRNPRNVRTKYITFNIVDMHYPYNASSTEAC
jgi:hypothetical protein